MCQVSVIKVQLNSLSVTDMRAVANVRGISDMSIERLIEQVGALPAQVFAQAAADQRGYRIAATFPAGNRHQQRAFPLAV
jgi:hypothetical protein